MANQRGDTQAKILAYIEKATLQKGYPPSVREIRNRPEKHFYCARASDPFGEERPVIPGFDETPGDFCPVRSSDVSDGND